MWVEMEAANEDECVCTVDWRDRKSWTESEWNDDRFWGELGGGERSMRASGIGLNWGRKEK